MSITEASSFGSYPVLSASIPWGYFYYRFECTTIPGWASFYSSLNGPELYHPPLGRYCLRLQRGGVTAYLPWIPITVNNMVQPDYSAFNLESPEILVHASPGVTINVYYGYLPTAPLIKTVVG